jgi:beta-N-acetylhexosaminidase
MAEAAIRRRRAAAALVLVPAAAFGFACGASLGDGSGAAPSAAARLTVSQLAGERIVAGFEGRTPPRPLRRMIRAGRIAGVALYADNLRSPEAGRRLIAELQRIRRPAGLRDPLLVMIDQEGGRVTRLEGAPAASAREMGLRGAAFSRRQGRLTAATLREAGANVDLAPVLDVARAGGVIAEEERGFGATAAAVSAGAVPFAQGLQAGGVAATAKHFPGLGAAALNTDVAVQRIGSGRARLRGIDEAPYRSFIAAGGDLVMLSTAIYPAFSPRPAAFSRALAESELRDRLGFRGVSITDALDSVAVGAFGGAARAGAAAAGAGTDLLLYTDIGPAASAHRALVSRLRSGALPRGPFEASADRVLGLRHRLGLR